MKIHWIFYLIIGGTILFASYKIDSKKFVIFILLGYFFLIVGVAKLGIGIINRKKESPVEKQMMQQTYAPQRRAVFCPKCRLNLYGYENFCPRCGLRLR